jgi:glycosyltransferase involved in cell wall biosynthesis
MRPTVSVVIPTHNRKDKLFEALRSVLAQTCSPNEIIVVDDCSTDGTADVDFTKLSPTIKLVRHTNNRGGSAARNTGVQNASGTWIALLDADDLWMPDKLERQLERLASDEQVPDVIVTNIVHRQPGLPDRDFNRRPPQSGEDISHYLMVANCAMQTSSLLVRRSLLLTCPFDETLRKHQDWDLVLRLQAGNARFAYMHQATSIYCTDHDPERISIKESDVRLSIDWLRTRHEFITGESAAYYFAYHCLSRAMRRGTLYAFQSWWHLSTRTPASLAYSIAGAACTILHRLNDKFKRRRTNRCEQTINLE